MTIQEKIWYCVAIVMSMLALIFCFGLWTTVSLGWVVAFILTFAISWEVGLATFIVWLMAVSVAKLLMRVY